MSARLSKRFRGNNRGTGPTATPVSPVHSANDEKNGGTASVLGFEPDEDDGALGEIEAEFRRKLAGLRRLRRPERALALRVAKDWRRAALKEWRERRARERHARRTLRRLQTLGRARPLDAPGL